MASLDETKDVKTTADSFSATVRNIVTGDDFKFYLYYDNGGGNRTAIVDGDEWKSTGQTYHEFKEIGLRAEADLMFTIAYLPAGKSDWTVEKDIKYVAQRSTARTKADKPAKVWPGNWTKWANLKQGDSVSLVTADDWNDFLDHINEVIDYKGGTKFNFAGYKKLKGDEMKANDFNDGAATAMKSIGLSPPSATAKSTITAQFFIDYEGALNSAK